MNADESPIEHDWRRVLDRAILFELLPLVAVVCSYMLATLLFWLTPNSLLGLAPFVVGLTFGASGAGWIAVGQRRLGWTILGGRLAVTLVALVMGFVVFGSALGSGLCETSRCRAGELPHLVGLTPVFVGTTAAVWIVALVTPLVSTTALGIWLHRHPRTA